MHAADVPACTTIASQVGDTAIVGISPDTADGAAEVRDEVRHRASTLLSDPDHAVAEAFGVWKEKKNYGKTYMGIERSAFLVGPDGTVRHAWYKISPKDTPMKLLEALAG